MAAPTPTYSWEGEGMEISDELRNVLRHVTPLGVPQEPCIECKPSIDGLNVTHEAMCPVALCIEDATQGDRRWFEAHPFVDFYHREITWGEGLEVLLADEKAHSLAVTHRVTAMGKVRVDRGSENVRFRRFIDVYFVIDGDRRPELN